MSSETTHVIFDLDGTLINSDQPLIDVLTDYARSHGKELTLDIKNKMGHLDQQPTFFKDFFNSLSLKEEFNRYKVINKLLKEKYERKFQLIAGVEKLVRHLHKHNIPMGIATANTRKHFTIVTRDFNDFFQDHFNPIVFGSDDQDVKNNKPDPEVYMVCANRFPQKPKHYKNVIIVEDSLTGITGAVASGMKTLLISDRKHCDFNAFTDKITLMCDSFHDFRPEILGLPAYES